MRTEHFIKQFIITQLSVCYLLLICHQLDGQNTIGGTNFNNVKVTTSNSQGRAIGEKTITDAGLQPNLNAASRFLGQATLGADLETISAVSETGFSKWIDAQTNIPIAFSLKTYVDELVEIYRDSLAANGEDPSEAYARSEYWRFAWWQYVMSAPDILRSRVALALSEIFVISENSPLEGETKGLASYYDLLLKHSFGNYRALLYDISTHPTMGIYLTFMNNSKTDIEDNQFPDENYAREVMQLFSIGLYELNLDGTRKLDGQGNFIPAYNNEDIAELAKVFTGFTWIDSPYFGSGARADTSYTRAMKIDNRYHEPGAKFLLNGDLVPNRNPVNGVADLEDAIDNLFYHPNVGPFLGFRLIQRLVKSNPSPAYVGRVASVFNDNGQGIRGDMKAIIRAILLDPEARDCALSEDPINGMLREPMVRYTHLARAFDAAAENSTRYQNRMSEFYGSTQQRPLSSPSVFNFFQPEFQPIGPIADMDMFGPEFQISNSLTTIGYTNEVYKWTFDEELMEYQGIYPYESRPAGTKVELNLDAEYQLVQQGKIEELLERFNLVLMHGKMTERTKGIIKDAVLEVPSDLLEYKMYLALFLTMISPDYLIMR
jgi:uncharacterized protein (DUF1800 family)